MLKNKTYTHEQIREVNYIRILQYLRTHHETTKAELGKHLQVSHTTINTYIQTLTEEGFVATFGTADSSGGRKPVIIKLLPNVRYSFGVSISPAHVSLMLINLVGDPIDFVQFPYSVEIGLQPSLIKIKEQIFAMMGRHLIEKDKILGVGMAFPGLVDTDNLVLEYIPNLEIKDRSLKEFQEELGLTVYPDNEANAAAYAEYLMGKGSDLSNFVYVSIAEGIGSGILIDRFLFRGRNKRAGEFGHLKVSDQKIRCSCGRYGCWELFASKRALLKKRPENMSDAEYLRELFRDYDAGVPSAETIIEEYVRYLFAGLDVILLSVDPSFIIIGGDLGAYMDRLIEIGINKLKLKHHFYGYESIRILSSGVKENASLLGAALLPLEQIFNYQRTLLDL
ncbi:MAG: xylR1 [Bacillota bacterium]|jgi:predicted NBD/HSP70 family sugar kinase|nr:xylR1 [Bacillota bacterium]